MLVKVGALFNKNVDKKNLLVNTSVFILNIIYKGFVKII